MAARYSKLVYFSVAVSIFIKWIFDREGGKANLNIVGH